MNGAALRVHGLCKSFRVYSKASDAVVELLSGRPRYVAREALIDVDFEIGHGEVVGVLGRNGAGKSTLLKIIAGTLERSAGTVEVDGRITAILELGTGFHPNYTGRENIRLGGMCLGMSRAEIDRKTDAIIDFAELREVIDQPFRTYSTGMQARLTFATAINVDPDILIIDEALAVGDARFQAKCFARIAEIRRLGKTILLVSHDTNTITTLCDRAIILESGRVHAQGPAREMSRRYLNLLFGQPTASSGPDASSGSMRYGDGSMRLLEYGLLGPDGRPTTVLESGQRCRLFMRARVEHAVEDASFGFAIKDAKGTVLWGVTNAARREPVRDLTPGETLDVSAQITMWLAAGEFSVNLGFGHLESGQMCDFIDDALVIRVVGPGGIFTTSTVNLDCDFSVQRRLASPAAGTKGRPVATESAPSPMAAHSGNGVDRSEAPMEEAADPQHRFPRPVQWTSEKVGRFWSDFSRTRLTELSFARGASRPLYLAMQHHLQPGTRVIDFGAGSGHLVEFLLSMGLKVAAYEPAEGRRAQIEARFRDQPGFLGVVGRDSGQSFDVAIAAEVVEHVLDSEFEETVGSLVASVRPEGLVIVTTPNQEDLELGQCICPNCRTQFHRWQHVRSFSADGMEALMRRFGITPVATHRLEFNPALFEPLSAPRKSALPDYLVAIKEDRSVRMASEGSILFVGRRSPALAGAAGPAAARDSNAD